MSGGAIDCGELRHLPVLTRNLNICKNIGFQYTDGGRLGKGRKGPG